MTENKLAVHAGTIAVALATIGCTSKLEATVTGPAPGSSDKVRVHVVGTGGAELTCSAGACEKMKLPYSGEGDVDVKVPPGDAKVVLTTKKGIRVGRATVDLAAGGKGSSLVFKTGSISCVPSGCKGSIDIAPRSSLSFEAPAGTTIEIGGEKLTVPAGGTLQSPLKLALAPPLERQPLATICTGAATPSPVLASTSITVTLPGKAPITTTASFDAALAEAGFARALDEIEKGPVVFPWKKPGQPAVGKRAAVFVHGFSCYDAGAIGATVADIDVIATADTEEREDECVYRLTGGGTARGKLKLNDKRAKVYDRITGRLLGTKLFAAPKDCDEKISLRGGSTYVATQTSYVNNDIVAKWAATFAK